MKVNLLATLAAWARRTGRATRRSESGNAFAVFIVMLPMLLAAFGMGVDVARNTYIRMSLQNDLDMAVVGGAAVTQTNSNGKLVISTSGAQAAVRETYRLNRLNSTNLDFCLTGNTNRCWQETAGAPAVTQNGTRITYSIRERSRNTAFLAFVGVPFQDYRLTSSAVLRPSGA